MAMDKCIGGMDVTIRESGKMAFKMGKVNFVLI